MEFSICTTTFNNAKRIRTCLESIIQAFDGLDFEIVVVDNYSTDGSYEIIQECVQQYCKINNCRVLMSIIYFFGPDGTGKSTLVKALASELHKGECKLKLSWMRGSHTLTSLLASFMTKFDCFKGSDNPYYNIRIPKSLKRLWQVLEFVSALPIIFSNYLVPSVMRYWVLADRYALDLIVWLCLTTRDPSFLNSFMTKLLLALAKKTNARFYVTADIEELKRRTKDLWLTKEQLCLYGKLAKAVDAHIIDTTNNSVEDSLQEVLAVVSATSHNTP